MPFFVYGNDARTGEPARRIFSAADTEAAARAEVEVHGVVQVTAIVPCRSDQAPQETPSLPQSAASRNGKIAAPMAPRLSYADSVARSEALAGIGRYMKIVGVIQTFLALSYGAFGMYAREWSAALQGLILLVLGVMTLGAASKFRSADQTPGDDPRPLNHALEGLRSLYLVQAVFLGLGLALIVIMIAAFAALVAFRR